MSQPRPRQPQPFGIASAVLSDVGRVREKNEDSDLVMDEHGLYVVADGMGGHNSGEIASRLAVEAIRGFFESSATDDMLEKSFDAYRRRRAAGQRRRSYDEFRLWKALEAANLNIFNTARRFPQFKDMGTTVVAVLFAGPRVYVGYVGDSRVYRIRGGKIVQLTEDHSLANEYVKLKILRKEDLPRFPYKNVIVRALGLGDRVKIDTFYKEGRPGDHFLLCSDGLTDLLSDEDICHVVMSAEEPKRACRMLVAEANARGGIDNITALIVSLHENEEETDVGFLRTTTADGC